jgi:hypothetical protein
MDEKASRSLAVFAFWFSMVVLALLPAFIPALMHAIAFNVFSLIVAILTIGAWVHFDARVHNVAVGPALRICIVMLGFIAVPVYVFRTRGLNGGLLWLLKVLGLFMLSVLLIGGALVTLGTIVT